MNTGVAEVPGGVTLAHLQLLPLVTGVQTVTLEEFASLRDSKFRPVLICKEPGPLTEAMEKQGVKSLYVHDLVRPISPIRDWRAFRGLLKELKALNPHILHTHSSKTGMLGRLAARLAGVPVVVHTVHGFAFPFATSRLVHFIYFLVELIGARFCDALIVLNESDRRIAVDRLKMKPGKVHLIPNGVRLEGLEYAEGDARSSIRQEVFGADDATLCVGMVGRLWRQKNPGCLLEAAKKVLTITDRPVKFFFIGDGELREELERSIVAEGLQDRVTVLGWRTDVPRLLSALDVFVLPSRWEGMPLAILEAMASGLAVIVSDIPGNHDLVVHGQDGLLFESENADDLAVRLLRLVEDGDFRHTLATAARNKVVEHYQLETRNQKVLELYDQLMDQKLA